MIGVQDNIFRSSVAKAMRDCRETRLSGPRVVFRIMFPSRTAAAVWQALSVRVLPEISWPPAEGDQATGLAEGALSGRVLI